MTWKRQSTSESIDLDVSLDSFREEQLLQALIDSKWLDPLECEAIAKRAKDTSAGNRKPISFVYPVGDDVDAARHEMLCGRRTEALILLERALGHDWSGVLTHA